MSMLEPLETLYDSERGFELPLPPELAALYGQFRLPEHLERPYVISNFVTTLDGVVTLAVPGHVGAGDISGFNPHDRMVMGLLRAIADVVIISEGSLRAEPDHLWTASYIFPPLADVYQTLRHVLGKTEPPLTVVVAARGEIDFSTRLFLRGESPVLIVTTSDGFERLRGSALPASVEVAALKGPKVLSPREILEAACKECRYGVVLVEGGPHLVGGFFAEQRLDELFLTLAPQIAGRDGHHERLGLVAGRTFAPERPLWGTLVGLKRGGSHLFLRYAFPSRIPE
jgi:riboflavin biosynthesis pyrimidine reductase